MEFRKCIKCGSDNPNYAKFCRKCGNELDLSKQDILKRLINDIKQIVKIITSDIMNTFASSEKEDAFIPDVFSTIQLNNAPAIEYFNYVSVPHVGDSIELSWSIKNADTAILNGQTMPLTHRYKVVVDKEMFLELVATKSGKRESKRIHIVPIPSSDKTIKTSTSPLITTSNALPDLVKVLLKVVVIDIFPLISLLFISCCSSWIRYTLNLSYNDWNVFREYANILLWIWVVSGIIWGFLKFYRYKKI